MRRTMAAVSTVLAVAVAMAGWVASSSGSGTKRPSVERVTGGRTGHYVVAVGIHKIKHVIIIMQENRSFDSYFGTYPGADGIPMKHGQPTVCVPDPTNGTVRRPYRRSCGRERRRAALVQERRRRHRRRPDGRLRRPGRVGQARMPQPDRPGLHELRQAGRDGLPHAQRHPELLDIRQGLRAPGPHVRAERLVEPAGASVPRLGVVGVLHRCRTIAASCRQRRADPQASNARRTTRPITAARTSSPADYAWTDITYLLHKHHVSWGYYVVSGTEPDCENPSQRDVRARRAELVDVRHLEPAAVVRHGPRRRPARQTSSPSTTSTLTPRDGHAAGGVVGHPVRRGLGAPAVAGQLRSELRHQPDQRGDEQPRLELDRDLPGVGRLGRLLRPRPPAARRPERLRTARPRRS